MHTTRARRAAPEARMGRIYCEGRVGVRVILIAAYFASVNLMSGMISLYEGEANISQAISTPITCTEIIEDSVI